MFNNQSYEEYIRSILGYDMQPQFETNRYVQQNTQIMENEGLYPDIYRIVYPMVIKSCRMNTTQTITKELIEQLTEEVYNAIENREVEQESNNKKSEDRQFNSGIRDIIRILLLRELFERPGFPGFRPPMPPPPPRTGPRPPMLRPPYPPMRPPYNRELNEIYEY